MSLLYTSVPLEQVFEDKAKAEPAYEEIQLEGKTLIVEPTGPYEGKLVRLISSNADDYLDPNYQPGSVIKYSPSLES